MAGAKAGKGASNKPDLASLLGLVVGIGGILGGMLMEKESCTTSTRYPPRLSFWEALSAR